MGAEIQSNPLPYRLTSDDAAHRWERPSWGTRPKVQFLPDSQGGCATPAMESKLTDQVWEIAELLA